MFKLFALSTTELPPELDTLGLAWEALQAHSERLAFERQRYIEVFASSPDAYLITDRRCTIVEANPAAAELLQRAVRFLAGKPFASLVPLDQRRAFELAGRPRSASQENQVQRAPRAGPRRRGHRLLLAAAPERLAAPWHARNRSGC